jgi:hypothetical protein
MLLRHPELFMYMFEDKMQDVFDVLHNEVGFPHEALAKFPQALTAKVAVECRHRHEVRLILSDLLLFSSLVN